MWKLKSLIAGMLVGAGTMYVGLQYHVLMAPEGMIMIPRSPQPRLQDAYVDIRAWDAKTWSSRPRLSVAVTDYGRADLIAAGAKQGLLDKLRGAIAPVQEQLGETGDGWEPANGSAVPAPIPDSQRVEPSQDRSPARKGFLPLADLFGTESGEKDRSLERAVDPDHDSRTKVQPAARTTPPEVEFLPPPDDIELGTPTQFPESVRSPHRQTDAQELLPKQSADGQQKWEPLSLLPDNLRNQAVLK